MWSLLSTEITLKRYSNTHIKGVCNNYNSVTKLIVTTASSYKCCFFKILFIFIYFLIIIIIFLLYNIVLVLPYIDAFYLCTRLRII